VGIERPSGLREALEKLTDEQRGAVEHLGNFSVIARPGSGKTRVVGLRLAESIVRGVRRTAVASYTNVAVEEVRGVCREVGVVIGREHFVDTLHAFLTSYVLRPFGHLVCGQSGRMRIRGDDWEQSGNPALGWRAVMLETDGGTKVPVSVVHFHLDRDGNAICHSPPRGFHYMDADQITARGGKQAVSLKRTHAKCGVVSQSDALYWALRVLREHPRLARAVAGRFDEIIVDEAQDTSDVQLACLEELMKTGRLRSLVAVADPEQSIYSFQGADPQRFAAFADAHALEPLDLTVNFRSSQRICDVAHGFTQRPSADRAEGPNAACVIPPEVFRYPTDDPVQAVQTFRQRIADHGLELDDAVVVVRARRLRDAIEGREDLETGSVLRALGRLAAASARGGTLSAREVRGGEEALLWMVNSEWDLPQSSRRKLRLAVGRLCRRLPPLEGTLGGWAAACREEVRDALGELVRDGYELAHKPGDVLKSLPKYKAVQASAHFVSDTQQPPIRTVHAVKGRSIDSVLLIVEAPRGGRVAF
jgi:DNA helicase II / ATP-dependent DNA helicase PcrA